MQIKWFRDYMAKQQHYHDHLATRAQAITFSEHHYIIITYDGKTIKHDPSRGSGQG